MAEAPAEALQDAKVKSPRVGTYSLDGLWIAWENSLQVRTRLKERNTLLLQYDAKLQVDLVATNGHVPKTISNLRTNRAVLSPLLNLMKQHSMMVPCLDRLIAEVRVLFDRNCSNLKDPGDVHYHTAKSVRQLASLLKGELARATAEVQKGVYKGKDYSSQNLTSTQKELRILRFGNVTQNRIPS